MLHHLSVEVLMHWSVDAIIAVHQFVYRRSISGKFSYSRVLEVCHECLNLHTVRIGDVFHQWPAMPETDIQINFDDFVIGDLPVIVVAQDGILDSRIEYEYLVKLVAQQVGRFAIINGLLKFVWFELVLHEWQVIVEVTTNYDCRQLILS